MEVGECYYLEDLPSCLSFLIRIAFTKGREIKRSPERWIFNHLQFPESKGTLLILFSSLLFSVYFRIFIELVLLLLQNRISNPWNSALLFSFIGIIVWDLHFQSSKPVLFFPSSLSWRLCWLGELVVKVKALEISKTKKGKRKITGFNQ